MYAFARGDSCCGSLRYSCFPSLPVLLGLTAAVGVMLTGGGKTGQGKRWHEQAIPRVEELYAAYLKERAEEEGR